MARLIVVSNRVDVPKRGQNKAGGLAVALREALMDKGGVWFGWSGEVADGLVPPPSQVIQGNITYLTTQLSRQDYQEFYNGYSNSTLWPLFHYRLGLLELSRQSFDGYLRVNRAFAARLAPLLKYDDVIWIHDYHLIPLGDELRKLGVKNRIGFFLHTPFPVPEILLALPGHARLMRALCSYDLVGFQTPEDVRAFLGYLTTEVSAEVSTEGHFLAYGRAGKAGCYPIGIDAAQLTEMAQQRESAADILRLKTSLGGRKLILGVERLDYSKGLENRFAAIEALLEGHPELKRAFEFMQIAAPSREEVGKYRTLKRLLESAAGRINGRFSEFDWQPIRYLNKSYDRATVAAFYRQANVALVTPLRDGMNLVAKEYVAAQNPEDPGVLILSRFAGAARQLREALIVNPFDADQVADALYRALTMKLPERQERWQALMREVETNSINVWRNNFLHDLTEPVAMAPPEVELIDHKNPSVFKGPLHPPL